MSLSDKQRDELDFVRRHISQLVLQYEENLFAARILEIVQLYYICLNPDIGKCAEFYACRLHLLWHIFMHANHMYEYMKPCGYNFEASCKIVKEALIHFNFDSVKYTCTHPRHESFQVFNTMTTEQMDVVCNDSNPPEVIATMQYVDTDGNQIHRLPDGSKLKWFKEHADGWIIPKENMIIRDAVGKVINEIPANVSSITLHSVYPPVSALDVDGQVHKGTGEEVADRLLKKYGKKRTSANIRDNIDRMSVRTLRTRQYHYTQSSETSP